MNTVHRYIQVRAGPLVLKNKKKTENHLTGPALGLSVGPFVGISGYATEVNNFRKRRGRVNAAVVTTS